jgi:hypothetical protein
VSAAVLINPIVLFHHLMLLLIPLALIIGEPFIDSVALKLGVFRREYEGATLRENLGLPRPQNRFFPGAVRRSSI